MRERIINALILASTQKNSTEETHPLSLKLAQQVLVCDQQHQWNLMANPNRLRILTIDALAAQLSAQMPLLARISPQAAISDNAEELYQKAVHALFNTLNEKTEYSSELKSLLLALDNRAEFLEELLIEMLGKREQWLPHIIEHHSNAEALRTQLESSLQDIAQEKLLEVDKKLDSADKEQLFDCIHFAANNLKTLHENHSLLQWLELQEFPPAQLDYCSHWNSLAKLLLTEEHQWRKSIDKRQGFPSEAPDKLTKAHYKEYKERFKTLIDQLGVQSSLRESFSELLLCPDHFYTEEQWQMIKHLVRLLPLLVAELSLVFQQAHCIDFIELNLGALRALGRSEQPTELALYLEYQIKHLLVDEFQDTSILQFKLLEQLIAQWQVGDGRSLFLVGDPMQSIYRFRNAEVGLFIRVQEQGIAQLELQRLQLNLNFRSTPQIVDWINQHFGTIFPENPNISLGSIPYAPSLATQTQQNNSGVHYHPVLEDSTADKTVEIIRRCRVLNPKASIAVLVRSRHQLLDIIPALHRAQLNFKALELEPLSDCMEIKDLLSLTQALLHLGDRSAWLSILRAPWCGLKLANLLALSQHQPEYPLWFSLSRFDSIPTLSQEACTRLQRIVPILKKALSLKDRLSVDTWIKETWLHLGGPAALLGEHQLSNVEHYFDLLHSLSQGSFSLEALQVALTKLYAAPNPHADDSLQVMSIHKAKGLEFDHVILPHLESSTRHEPSQLLRWLERPHRSKSSALVLAPLSLGEQKDPIYNYVLGVEKERLHYESLRLFYVAVSRAKCSLHLISELCLDEDSLPKPPLKRSFMNYLWPFYQGQIQVDELLPATHKLQAHTEMSPPRSLRRLSAKWVHPLFP